MSGRKHASVLVVGIALGLSVGVPAQGPVVREKVLIRAAKPYASVVARVQSLGGVVTYQYRYIDAVAADVPVGGLSGLRDLVGTAAISKDLAIDLPQTGDIPGGKPLPAAIDHSEVQADAVEGLSGEAVAQLADTTPQAYLLNNAIANVTPIHAGGNAGQGVIVAVIDSGIRPGFPHITLDGSVVGCEDFVGDALGCSNAGNNPHGTQVAGMVSANVVFTFSPLSAVRNAVLAECPACFSNPPTNTQIPMLGTAPLSSIYALRVFGATGGAPTSRVLAAMERAIELRELYEASLPGGANVTVVNMSLGGPTLFAGRDFFDQMVDVMIDRDILPVIAAGNDGQASLTIGSPGSAFGAVTVGAANLSHNERILRDLQFGLGIGPLYRPSPGPQTAYFSARGPNADGRVDPDVIMNGFASYAQGSGGPGTISFVSGTSFATPSTSGVAALLRKGFPGATARQIRNAIIASANPNIVTDGSTEIDQGAGYVDAVAAAALLAAGSVPDTVEAPPNATQNVNVNIQHNTFLRVRNGSISETASDLEPGQRHEIVYRVAPNTNQVVVSLANVTPALPPAQQNQLFGDDILLTVHTAKTSGIGDYRFFAFTVGGTFVINNPEPGLMRITTSGDWTNAGTISADVSVTSTSAALPQFSAQGKIADQQTLAFPVTIPSGTAQAEFRLEWREGWGRFPTADIDLILVNPSGGSSFLGSTLNMPEVAVINNPAAGNWTVLVRGFEIHTATDKFELRVSLDGNVVKIK
jgi:subtilisin family serine protease